MDIFSVEYFANRMQNKQNSVTFYLGPVVTHGFSQSSQNLNGGILRNLVPNFMQKNQEIWKIRAKKFYLSLGQFSQNPCLFSLFLKRAPALNFVKINKWFIR
jgi:hypothetical protein